MFKFLPVLSEVYVCLTFRLKFNAYTFHIETFLIDSSGFFWWDPCCSSFQFYVLCFCVLFIFVMRVMPNIAYVSGLFYLSSSCVLCPILPMSLDCFMYLRHVCYAQYCLCLWIVLFIFIMCVMPNIAYVSGLSILICQFDFL